MAGTHLLAVQGGALGHVLTRRRPIRTLADLADLRLRAPDEIVPVLRALGANPVTMPMGEVYSGLSKGSIDGVIAPADTMQSLHFNEVAPYFSELSFPRGAYPARAISNRAWRRLSPDLQRVLDQSKPFWQAALSASVEKSVAAGLNFAQSHGEHMIPADPAAQRALDALFASRNSALVGQLGSDAPYAAPMYAAAQRAVGELRAGRPPC